MWTCGKLKYEGKGHKHVPKLFLLLLLFFFLDLVKYTTEIVVAGVAQTHHQDWGGAQRDLIGLPNNNSSLSVWSLQSQGWTKTTDLIHVDTTNHTYVLLQQQPKNTPKLQHHLLLLIIIPTHPAILPDSSDSDYSHIYGRLPIPTRSGVRKFPAKPLFLRLELSRSRKHQPTNQPKDHPTIFLKSVALFGFISSLSFSILSSKVKLT